MRIEIKTNKHTPLAIALLAPIFLIVFVWVSILVPKLTTHPKYDFLYTLGPTSSDYQVSADKLTVTEYPPESYLYRQQRPKLYRFDVSKDQSEEITLEEGQTLTLDKSTTSPDKIEIVSANTNIYIVLFARPPQNGVYLKKDGYVKKLEIPDMVNRYDFHFIAWVLK